jgi:NAD(P)-dependent dehydrogenase (short-subunit alcohol dehydrogenase family)
MGRLENKVAIVTGGAQGLGAAIAAGYAREGARVMVGDLDGDGARAVANSLDVPGFSRRVDVSDEADMAALVADTITQFGGLDIMVNNAGILGPTGSILEVDASDWDATMSVHLRGTFLGIKHAARAMCDRGLGGVILNTASTAGVRGGLGPHAYTAAKHGIIGLTESVATELVADNIRVNAIAPGSHLTPMVARVLTGRADGFDEAEELMRARSPQGRVAFPKDIVGAYIYLATDEAWFANGATLVIDGAREVLANLSVSNRRS